MDNNEALQIAWSKFVSSSPEYLRWWEILPNQYGGRISINLDQQASSRSSKFNCEQLNIKMTFDNSSKSFGEAQNEIKSLFKDLHLQLLAKMNDKDKIRLVFFHDDFKEGPVRFPFLSKDQFVLTNLINNFNSVIQSYREIRVNNDQNFNAVAIIAKLPCGTGRNSYKSSNFKTQQDFLNNSTSIINIFNDDNLCGLRAVIIAIAAYENDPNLNTLLKRNSINLFKKVKKISRRCNLKDRPMGIDEFKKVERYFKFYQITIINGDEMIGDNYVYIGPPNKKHIYICYTKSHYNVIKSMKQFLNRQYYCDYCKKGYANQTNHKCAAKCSTCIRFDCINENIEFENNLSYENYFENENNDALECSFCKIKCRNDICKSIHEEKICYKLKLCEKCKKIKRQNHVCGDNSKWCTNCQISCGYEHKCYILKEKKSKKKSSEETLGYIFFDYECFQFENKHVPNLIIAEKVCNSCIYNQLCTSDCQMFKFLDNISFCEWLFSNPNSGFIAIAHNMKGYDGIFLLQYIVKSHVSIYSKPEIILNGTKILSLKYRDVKVIDSLSFLPMPLEKFAKTFDLKELKKGFFPHKFNTIYNQNYVGDFPSKEYYDIDYFSLEKRKEFETWYLKNSQKTFNFKQEIEDYCISDVKLLKEGCISFRKIILDKSNLDPFSSCITIASLCHHIFRKNIMKENTIAIIPPNGYNPEQKTSVKAMKWIKFLSYFNNVFIRHAKNGGEITVGKYLLDGYSENVLKDGMIKKTIYEFHGCVFHGCQKCFSKVTWNPIKNELMSTTYLRHQKRIAFIKYKMFDAQLIEIWECEYDYKEKNDKTFGDFIKQLDILDPLNPRDSLFGGRTNALKLHYK